MADVKIDPSPTNLQEACLIITNELQKHGELYEAFVASVNGILKPKERHIGDACFNIELEDMSSYDLAEQIENGYLGRNRKEIEINE